MLTLVGVLISVGKPWLWCCIWAHQDVYDPDEFCKGLGSGVPPSGRHQHSVLDWDPSQRTTPVAGQSPLTDGVPTRPYLFCII